MFYSQYQYILSKNNCEGVKQWSSDIANGRVAPWTYNGGDKVVNYGVLYQAMWGGQEVPGRNLCNSEETCRFNGWQWMTVKNCQTTPIVAPKPKDPVYPVVKDIFRCVNYLNFDNFEVCKGRIIYQQGITAIYKNKLYISSSYTDQFHNLSQFCTENKKCIEKSISWRYLGPCKEEIR